MMIAYVNTPHNKTFGFPPTPNQQACCVAGRMLLMVIKQGKTPLPGQRQFSSEADNRNILKTVQNKIKKRSGTKKILPCVNIEG
jgi:hypothetical protein